MNKEKQFETKIKTYLKGIDCWYVKFFANAFTKAGVPDILVCINGRFVAIEVKSDNGKPTALQKENIKQIRKNRGLAIILYPDQFEQFKSFIKMLSEGLQSYANLLEEEMKFDKEKI